MESLFKCFVVIHYFQLPWTGTSSGDFTTNLAPQCNAFSRALKFETVKKPNSPVPRDDWCIIPDFVKVRNISQPSFDFFAYGKDLPIVAKLSFKA